MNYIFFTLLITEKINSEIKSRTRIGKFVANEKNLKQLERFKSQQIDRFEWNEFNTLSGSSCTETQLVQVLDPKAVVEIEVKYHSQLDTQTSTKCTPLSKIIDYLEVGNQIWITCVVNHIDKSEKTISLKTRVNGLTGFVYNYTEDTLVQIVTDDNENEPCFNMSGVESGSKILIPLIIKSVKYHTTMRGNYKLFGEFLDQDHHYCEPDTLILFNKATQPKQSEQYIDLKLKDLISIKNIPEGTEFWFQTQLINKTSRSITVQGVLATQCTDVLEFKLGAPVLLNDEKIDLNTVSDTEQLLIYFPIKFLKNTKSVNLRIDKDKDLLLYNISILELEKSAYYLDSQRPIKVEAAVWEALLAKNV